MCKQLEKADMILSEVWALKMGGCSWVLAFVGCALLIFLPLFGQIDADHHTSVFFLDYVNAVYFAVGSLAGLGLGLVLASTTVCDPFGGAESLHKAAVRTGSTAFNAADVLDRDNILHAKYEHLRFLHLIRVKPLGATLCGIAFTESRVVYAFLKIAVGIPAALSALHHMHSYYFKEMHDSTRVSDEYMVVK